MKFVGPNGQFDVEAAPACATDTLIMAQEILVDSAAYPTEMIAARIRTTTGRWGWDSRISARC